MFLVKPEHRLSAGYAWFGTHTHTPEESILHENRLWQQYLYMKQAGLVQCSFRIRTEQRWRQQSTDGRQGKSDDLFEFRTRFMVQAQGPFSVHGSTGRPHLEWQAASEIMLHAGEGIGTKYFDQVRCIAGPVLQFSGSLSLAALYQYIHQYRFSQNNHQNIHTLRLTLLHSFDLCKPKRERENGLSTDAR